MKELAIQIAYYFSQIWTGWSVKMPFALVTGLYTGYLGGDWLLFLIFFFMVGLDLCLGTCLAIRRKRFDPRLFGLWVVKVLTHCTVIVIVGLAVKSLLGPLSINFPLLDLFLGLLICTDALSILKNMQRLVLPVPRLATRLLADMREQAEAKAAVFFSRPENDRRKQPRSDSRPRWRNDDERD